MRLVFRRPRNIVLGSLGFLIAETFYLWSSQVLSIGPHGVSYLIEPDFVIAGTVIALLFGVELPLLIHAIQLAATSPGTAGSTLLGTLLGVASTTCCAPVLLPSLLSLLGASGTSILGVDTTIHRYWLPLATASIVLLTYSVVSLIGNINLECRVAAMNAAESSLTGPRIAH